MSKLFSSLIFIFFLLFQTTSLAEEDSNPSKTNIEESQEHDADGESDDKEDDEEKEEISEEEKEAHAAEESELKEAEEHK